MTEARLRALLSRFGDLRIAVAGDLFLDRWWTVDRDLDEPSVETGLTAYQVTGTRVSPGAAGTVLGNLSALGVGTLRAVSLIGEDGDGWELLRLLKARRVDTAGVIASGQVRTPCYTKPMFTRGDGAESEDCRFDLKNRRPTPPDLRALLANRLTKAAEDAHAVIILDQLTDEDTGVVTGDLRRALADLGARRPDLLLWADSRAFLDRFSGVTLKCNDEEARRMILGESGGEFDPEILARCLALLRRRAGRPAVVTCGARGVLVEGADGPRLLPALPVSGPIDVCGCGDACTAGMVAALCAGAAWDEAAEVGNLCAAVTIRKIGTTGTASPAELLEALTWSK